jgi:hypothetical protein
MVGFRLNGCEFCSIQLYQREQHPLDCQIQVPVKLQAAAAAHAVRWAFLLHLANIILSALCAGGLGLLVSPRCLILLFLAFSCVCVCSGARECLDWTGIVRDWKHESCLHLRLHYHVDCVRFSLVSCSSLSDETRMMAGGFYIPISDLPVWLRWLQWLSFTRYAYEVSISYYFNFLPSGLHRHPTRSHVFTRCWR